MDLPSLRHFTNTGIYYISSDPVEVLHGEAWVPAIYTGKVLKLRSELREAPLKQ